ncbi:WhiB family transcriptional regulator [Streptomyces cinereoruber]|uniref:WhiB family transcriptional regulator n=1 Tax=Streptomyces cinereoruber TaxID=67260 RepID=UPI00362A43C4
MHFLPRRTDHSSPARPHDWRDDAACKGVDPTTFFPSRRGAVWDSGPAKKVCAGCPSIAECLRHALSLPEESGVWGGLDEDERLTLIRRARQAAEDERRKATGAADAVAVP